jgi:hypothetical protein
MCIYLFVSLSPCLLVSLSPTLPLSHSPTLPLPLSPSSRPLAPIFQSTFTSITELCASGNDVVDAGREARFGGDE